MRATSNPVFRNLPRGQGGYAGFGSPVAGANHYPQPGYPTPPGYPTQSGYFPQQPQTRALTIDDVVTKTAITWAVLAVAAIVSYGLVSQNTHLAPLFVLGGGIVGLILVMVATFGRKMDSAPLVLSYAVVEGLFVGAFSFMFTDITFGGVGGASLIGQAVLGSFGVFAGMLAVYKTGAIRVTPRLTRVVVGAIFGILALVIGNLVASFFIPGGFGLRSGGPMAIVFSLVVIAVAAFSFLLDFDAADQMIRAQVPEKYAWGIALGLTVTMVWLYTEILRLLSYLQSD